MGEAKRRKVEIAALKAKDANWLASLQPEERIVAEVSLATYNKVVVGLEMTEGCYNLAFFLNEYFRQKHDIGVNVVVGWINDGSWEGAASHAWVEYQGKKIDIALHKTSHPDIQPSGDLIILDHIARSGTVPYTYWQTLPDRAARALEQMRSETPELEAIIVHKETEHRKMLELASKQGGAREYLRQAPPTNNYEFLSKIVGA